MQLFVDFYVFTRFWLNLSDRNLKLFWTSKQNNFRFRSSKFSQKRVKTQKATNNGMSSFGLIEKIMELSHIFLTVQTFKSILARCEDLLTWSHVWTTKGHCWRKFKCSLPRNGLNLRNYVQGQQYKHSLN